MGPPFDWSTAPQNWWPEHLRSIVPLRSTRPVPRDRLLHTPWVYCVEVCQFTFRFPSVAEIAIYRDDFAATHRPSQRRPNPRQAKGSGDRRRTFQTGLARLPLRLKKKAQRAKVVQALERAIRHFAREST